MAKRGVVFGTYNTAAQGWTLNVCHLGEAEPKTNYIDKPNGDGTWDASTALTDGIVRFNNRDLTVRLECSDGDRLGREAKIADIINLLHGTKVDIELPDDPYHYLRGRLKVTKEYNDLAHAAINVTGICEPWKYATRETVITLNATTAVQTAQIINGGRRVVVPVVKVTTTDSVRLTFQGTSQALGAGTYQLPDLVLMPGSSSLSYTGIGTVTITYREAVLE